MENISKRLYLLFLTLFGLNAVCIGSQRGSTSNIVLASELIGEKLPECDQKFVDSIADELEILEPIETCFMNNRGKALFGSTNILAYGNILFIGEPAFLQSLSLDEKRFIIARELLAIDYFRNNAAKMIFKDLFFWFAGAISTGILFTKIFPIPRRHNYNIFDYYDRQELYLRGMLSSILIIPSILLAIKEIFRLKNLAYKFDESAAIGLENFDGAISYLTNYDKYYSNETSDKTLDKPTFKKRIDNLKKLKSKYIEE